MKTAPAIPTENKLTKRQSDFIDHLIKNGGKLEEAALSAGYSPKSARGAAGINVRLSHVQAEFNRRLNERLMTSKALAFNTLSQIADNQRASADARVKAANSIWDRAAQLESIGNKTGGIAITINMGSDLSATKQVHGVVIDEADQEIAPLTHGVAVSDD